MSESLKNKLASGLAEMDLQVSDAQQQKLLDYIALIHKWNKVHNLTAIRDPLEMVTLHLLDSLSVLPYVHGKRLLDVGAGAGLPSIPLAICLPELQVIAIDAVQKKASFMLQAKGELGLTNFNILAGRVEAQNIVEKFDTIVSRAFSEIDLFIKFTQHLLTGDGQWLAMKGVVPEHEFAKKEFNDLAVTISVIKPLKVAGLSADRHLIVLKKQAELI